MKLLPSYLLLARLAFHNPNSVTEDLVTGRRYRKGKKTEFIKKIFLFCFV